MSRQYKVFLSHGSGDTYIASKLLRPQIEAAGAEVFVDAAEISFGDDFRDVILSKLKKCDELVVLLTPTSILRPWIFAEIGVNIAREKRLVPIIYGPTENALRELGIDSLLGWITPLDIGRFDDYLEQLDGRVKGHANA